MRKPLLALLLLVAAPAFAQSPLTPGTTPFSCFVEAVTATTQCQVAAAAPFRIYVTGWTLTNEAATVQTLDITYGTGANCGTTIVPMTHKIAFPLTTSAVTTPQMNVVQTNTALIAPAGFMVCVRPTQATAFGATLTGFIAP